MNSSKDKLAAAGFTRREGLLALIGGVAALSGCGGGGSDAGAAGTASVGSGGTGSFSSGAITGFGSIIVNGVRFDDSQARITDDDGAVHTSADLKLGMVVSVIASTVPTGATATTSATATATTITFGSELRGPIDSITGQTLVVLGQTVSVGANTVFDNGIVGGLAGLSVGQIIEVHGFVDPTTNKILATRIEREATAASLKLQGQVQALNTTAKTFALGTTTISFAGIAAAALPANLANGLLVRVVLAPTPATGTRTALSLTTVARRVEDHGDAELEGTVTAFTSASSFSVNGVAVDASKATFPNGNTALKLGARVEVKGSTTNGVLTATEVKVENENEVEAQEFELHGTLSSLNVTVKSFLVRGVTVSFSGAVRFDNGDVARLSTILGTSATIEVRGTYNAATNTVTATRIKFES
jgi:hypothetical protein